MRAVLCSAYQVHSPLIVTSLPTRPLQSRLERVCSRGEDSRGPWGLTGYTSLLIGFHAHLGQADRPLVADRRANLLIPPQLILSAAPKDKGCGGMNRPRALSVPSTLDSFDHAPQRVGHELPLDQPHEQLTRPGQWVCRAGAEDGLRSIQEPWSTYRLPRTGPSSPTFILPLHSSTPSSEPSCSSLILRYLGAFSLVTSVMPVLILGSIDLPFAAFVACWTPTFPIA
jgi:hypothetical protein